MNCKYVQIIIKLLNFTKFSHNKFINKDGKHKSMTKITEKGYLIGKDNICFWGFNIHNPVFFISAGLILSFVAITLFFSQAANEILVSSRNWSLVNFDSFMMLAVNGLLFFCVLLIFLPLGKIRLGGRDAKTEFSRLSWLTMLFAAGMGIGLMFWGVSEPMAYFTGWAGTPLNVKPWSDQAAELAMASTIYHWGFHAWAIYGVAALALAFFTYNCGLPLTFRSAFYPLLGNYCWRWPGHVIDTFAVLATMFGLATSLGLGASQINSGLSLLFGFEDDFAVKFSIIAIVTIIASISVIRGLNGGIKLLSNLNMLIAFLLLLFIMVVNSLPQTLEWIKYTCTHYVKNFLVLSDWNSRSDTQWMQNWTVFYWAWWVSWSPFVGLFIARISKGRTVREFLLAVLCIPTLVTLVWMGMFGMNAITQAQAGIGSLAEGVSSISLATFQMLENLPMSEITTIVSIVLILIFFITSCDSGSMVIDSITAGGKFDSPIPQRIFWVVLLGLIASVLLYGGGQEALMALQAGTIITGIPFTTVLILISLNLLKGLTRYQKINKD